MANNSYSTLYISPAAYDEIAEILRECGYSSVIDKDGCIDIERFGIAKKPSGYDEDRARRNTCFRCSMAIRREYTPQNLCECTTPLRTPLTSQEQR